MAYKYVNDNGLKAYTKKVKEYISSLLPTKSVTYAELKALRDAGGLLAGRKYRITDFVTTSVQAETRSAGHAFDIIVVADDESTLNENARAILHKGDTYFADCKLSAWELKYCLDNDTNRFAWADAANGKGVVWWMKDEWNNECYYDFKNIQYKLYAGTGDSWNKYLEDLTIGAEDIVPYRLTKGLSEAKLGKYSFDIDNDNFIWAYTWSAYEDTKQTFDKSLKADGTKDTYDDIVHDCKVGANWETLQQDDETVYSRISLNFYIAIPFFLDSKDESFRTYSVKIGENCHDIVTGRKCNSNSFGNDCSYWTCGNDCYYWTCGNNCSYWTCGNTCSYWTCGNDCSSWTCGNNCYSWTCGNDCYSWTCGNNCYSWTCGNDCSSWTCGNDCSYWTCGNDCSYWTCGNTCSSWTCGNDCYSWTCGNDCSSWTCGNEVRNTKILQDYVSYFHLDSGVSNVTIQSSGTPTSGTPLKNFIVKAGVKGASSTAKLAIVIDASSFPLNSDYEWTIAKNSSGAIKQYCEADLIN